MRGRQREIVILRSDDAETWKEHSLEATDQAVRSALGSVFGGLFSSNWYIAAFARIRLTYIV